jgi:hypothetical protein
MIHVCDRCAHTWEAPEASECENCRHDLLSSFATLDEAEDHSELVLASGERAPEHFYRDA